MRKVLIIADQEGKGHATPRGMKLAAKMGVEVDIVGFTYAPLDRLHLDAREQAEVKQRLLDERAEVLQKRIDRYQQPDQSVKLKVVWEKNISSWIAEACERGDYIGVVKTGHRSDTLVHTSTDWQLLRECPVPVFIVAGKKWHHTKPVLVSLDLGTNLEVKKELNHKVLAAAKGLAEGLGVELEIITAIEIPALLSDLDLVDPVAYTREAREEMQPHIDELAAAHNIPLESFRSKRGPVEKVIVSRAAKIRAQAVVIGTVARKGVKARLLGNTAERVLRDLKTDVLAIKP